MHFYFDYGNCKHTPRGGTLGRDNKDQILHCSRGVFNNCILGPNLFAEIVDNVCVQLVMQMHNEKGTSIIIVWFITSESVCIC